MPTISTKNDAVHSQIKYVMHTEKIVFCLVMDDVKISKVDRFRFDFLEKIWILNNDRFFPPT